MAATDRRDPKQCEADAQQQTFETEDAREGITAMMEKRAPRFSGR